MLIMQFSVGDVAVLFLVFSIVRFDVCSSNVENLRLDVSVMVV